jgi:hypothetical protein
MNDAEKPKTALSDIRQAKKALEDQIHAQIYEFCDTYSIREGDVFANIAHVDHGRGARIMVQIKINI